jgi:TRAP transporter TAXI family solute receptor
MQGQLKGERGGVMLRVEVVAFAACAALLQWLPAHAGVPYKIVTADTRGTYYAIGNDLAKMVAPQAGIDLEVVPTNGSAENIKLLRHEPGVKLAIVQADVYQAFVDRGAANSKEAARIIRPLRVILPLYNTEIHYVARADSQLNYLHDLKDAKINGGLVGSGAAFITHTLYRMMFEGPIPEASASYMPNAEALVKLITDKSIDVAVVAAGQPAPIIAGMKPEAQKFIKLLKFDPSHPASKSAMKIYSPATVRAASYPNILKEDFTTISVGAFLVTYEYTLPSTVENLTRFARSLCQQFPALQEKGHAKWKEVDLTLPALNDGWTYYGPTAREIRACRAPAPRTAAKPVRPCTPEEKILGLCG